MYLGTFHFIPQKAVVIYRMFWPRVVGFGFF